jgi:hypothetical protein
MQWNSGLSADEMKKHSAVGSADEIRKGRQIAQLPTEIRNSQTTAYTRVTAAATPISNPIHKTIATKILPARLPTVDIAWSRHACQKKRRGLSPTAAENSGNINIGGMHTRFSMLSPAWSARLMASNSAHRPAINPSASPLTPLDISCLAKAMTSGHRGISSSLFHSRIPPFPSLHK